jgi:filamentous hemagglutinin
MRNGEKVILNTRTSAALKQAGIPMSKWKGVDRTGVEVPGMKGTKFDDLAEDQIKNNYKKGESLATEAPDH